MLYDRRGFGRSSRPSDGYDFDTLAGDLDKVLEALDLRDATVVGFSLGTGELARYIGTHGTERLRACVFIESLAPSFAKSAENPEGVDPAGVADVQQAILDDRYKWLTGLLGDLFNLDENLGSRISEETVRASWDAGRRRLAGRHVGVPARVAGGLRRRHRADRRPDADPPRHRRPDPADRRAGPAVARRAPRRALRRDRGRAARQPRHPRRGGQPRAARVPPRARGRHRVSAMAVQSAIVLEPSAQGIVDATSKPPFLYELEPAAARKVLDDLQAAPIDKLPVEEEWITVPADVGDVRVRIVKPAGGSTGTLPVVVYMHGGGWILGNAATHDRLVRELAVGARAALLFVEYPNSPEARYPVAIEQGYATAQWVVREGASHGLDAGRMAVAGESVGGNMAAALTLMAKSARRRALRADVDVLPGHRRGDGHRVLRRVRRGVLPHAQGDGVVLGRLHRRPRRAGARSPRRPTRPPPSSCGGCRPRCCSSTRPTRCATRARPTRPSCAWPASLSRPCATTASCTTSCCSTR